jgi:hypothetical protein
MTDAVTAARSHERVAAIGPAATMPELGERARDVVAWMKNVEQAEAGYARAHLDLGRASAVGAVLGARRRAAREAFDGLLGAVRGLRVAWQLFQLRAATQRLTWQAALQRTLPGLFSEESLRPDGLRTDTVFSYAVAATAGDVAQCFLWRLEGGYC